MLTPEGWNAPTPCGKLGSMEAVARYRGALLGLAVGDALGMPVQSTRGTVEPPLTDMVGGSRLNLPAGCWTDDTSLALCLAESLIACRGFDPVDQLTRYCRWMFEGHNSSTGFCFDLGATTHDALQRFHATRNPYPGLTAPDTAGNGSLMRLAPVPLFFAGNPGEAIRRAADSSRTTHATAEAVDACRYFAGLLVGALQARPKAELLSPMFCPVPGLWDAEPLTPTIAQVASGSFIRKDPPGIRGLGHVVRCLEAALWAFHRTDSFREAVLRAVNLGDDADTTGAVCGQIAGAYYGEQAIPDPWRATLAKRETIEAYATRLWDLASQHRAT